jgi:hypothetical protein
MKNRWRRVVFGLALVGGVWAPDTGRTQEPQTVRIGIVVDGPWERNDEILTLFEQEITELLVGDFDVRFPAAARVDGGWTSDGVRSGVDRLLADPEVDLVLAVGVLASADAARRATLPKPVIGPFVFDAELQGLPLTGSGTSGIPNLNYLAHPASFDRNARVFQEVVPFRSLAVLMSEAYAEGAPALWSGTRAAAEAMDLEATLVPVGRTADSALALLPPDVDAVYVLPLTQLLVLGGGGGAPGDSPRGQSGYVLVPPRTACSAKRATHPPRRGPRDALRGDRLRGAAHHQRGYR